MTTGWLGTAAYALVAYIVSWGYFFFTLPLVINLAGGNKTVGVAINYAISWVLMLAVLYVLQKLKGRNDTTNAAATVA